MIPYVLILLCAIIGAFIHGLAGFLIGGGSGFVATLAFGWMLRKSAGGLLPRKTRDETATDFVAERATVVAQAYQSITYVAFCGLVQLLFTLTFLRVVMWNRRRQTFASAAAVHGLTSLWLASYAFPYYGELP